MDRANSKRKAVVLLSGGLDSATTAAIARNRGLDVIALTFLYGQKHAVELQAAKRVANSLGISRHLLQQVDLQSMGGSALTDDVPIPKHETASEIPIAIPVTYVPARNTIFLALALGWAEVCHAHDIFIGVNAIDYSGYPDCRPVFIETFQKLADVATKMGVEGHGVRIQAPLLHLSKAEIIREGASLGVDFSLTHSCYDPTVQGLACGHCDSCLLRRQGFHQAGLEDPILYAAS